MKAAVDQETVIHFWFEELKPSQHWQKDRDLDAHVVQRFGELHGQGARGELWHWRDSAIGRLAEIIVLDQFSRNIHRDDPLSFAQDGMALILAQEMVIRGIDSSLPMAQRTFVYMPYMHSESLLIHEQAIALFDQPGLEDNLKFEYRHKQIIERFGRYPHRNAVLGRASTAEELAFLQEPGSSF